MKHRDADEGLERLLQILAEAEAALAGPGPQAVRTAVEMLSGAESLLRCRLSASDTRGSRSPAGGPDLQGLEAARRRLERIQRMVEFGAAYWTGLVSCSVAADAYGPGGTGAYGAPPAGELHG